MFSKKIGFVLVTVLINSIFIAPASAEQAYGTQSTEQVTEIKYFRSDYFLVPAGGWYSKPMNCGSNRHPTGGGFQTYGSVKYPKGFRVINSYPSSATQWTVSLRNHDNVARWVRAFVVCAS